LRQSNLHAGILLSSLLQCFTARVYPFRGLRYRLARRLERQTEGTGEPACELQEAPAKQVNSLAAGQRKRCRQVVFD
jgi:hypothetical protein